MSLQQVRGFDHQILRLGHTSKPIDATHTAIVPHAKPKTITAIEEPEDGLQAMVAIIAPPEYAQHQIQLGRRRPVRRKVVTRRHGSVHQPLARLQHVPVLRLLLQNLPPESATSLGQMYYYYYATQVLHHLEGTEFDLWNHRMREHLLRTQEKQGHQAGSWSPEGVDWGKQGGRLYATSLALSTLEVYYRHFPMYRPASKPTP